MSTALLVFTDGRGKCLKETLNSFQDNVVGEFKHKIIVNDCPDDREFTAWVRDRYREDFKIVPPLANRRRGFDGAIRAGWAAVRELRDVEYVVHLEDDFKLLKTLDLSLVQKLLDKRKHIVQVALLRNPVAPQEIKAGAVWKTHPECYRWSYDADLDVRWYEQRLFFTTNPSMYRKSLVRQYDWPNSLHSEGIFTKQIFDENPDWYSAYLGSGEEWVRHIGEQRKGTRY